MEVFGADCNIPISNLLIDIEHISNFERRQITIFIELYFRTLNHFLIIFECDCRSNVMFSCTDDNTRS